MYELSNTKQYYTTKYTVVVKCKNHDKMSNCYDKNSKILYLYALRLLVFTFKCMAKYT